MTSESSSTKKPDYSLFSRTSIFLIFSVKNLSRSETSKFLKSLPASISRKECRRCRHKSRDLIKFISLRWLGVVFSHHQRLNFDRSFKNHDFYPISVQESSEMLKYRIQDLFHHKANAAEASRRMGHATAESSLAFVLREDSISFSYCFLDFGFSSA